MGYVINHCISLFQKEQKEQRQEQYNEFLVKSANYIAQGIQAIVNGLSQEEAIIPFIDFISDEPEDIYTAEEIINGVLERSGLGG